MTEKRQQILLAKLVGLQMSGYILVEILFGILVAFGVLPAFLSFQREGVIVAEVSTVYVVIIGLVAVLLAGFWVALLVEVFEIFTIKEFDLVFSSKKKARSRPEARTTAKRTAKPRSKKRRR